VCERHCPSGDGNSALAATGNGRPICVLLVEADSQVASDVVRDFGRDGIAVAPACTLAEAKIILRQGATQVDVAILASRLPDGRGESLLPEIEACPRQPAVIITSSSALELEAEAFEYRPVIIPKPASTASLLRVVRRVAAGYARPMIRRFVRRFGLSRRETEALALLAQGLSAREIGHRLACSEKTIYFHLANISKKTNCHDYREVVGRLFAFACQSLGRTPPEHAAFVDARPSGGA